MKKVGEGVSARQAKPENASKIFIHKLQKRHNQKEL